MDIKPEYLKSISFWGLLILSVALSGCAINAPTWVREVPEDDPTITQVRENIPLYKDVIVRWGGVIVSVDNDTDRTSIEIVSRELYRSGRPRSNDYSPGRFIAIIPTFLDPSVYKTKREITVKGAVQNSKKAAIGEYDYIYPVIDVKNYHLWEPLQQLGYGPQPYYPYYPYYPYDPFYFHYYHRYRHHYHY